MIEALEGKKQRFEKESNDAMNEFSRIVEDEEERTQQVADREKERIIQKKRTNGTIRNCPVCLEEICLIRKHEEYVGAKVLLSLCCGTLHCYNCSQKSNEFMNDDSHPTNARCFNCREPVREHSYWAKTMKPNEQRHWLLSAFAIWYMSGTNGLKKNTKKAIKLFHRAAELGDRDAQLTLTDYYYRGELVPKCLQKARYYAEKAVDHGSHHAQNILAVLIEDSETNCEEEVVRLYTLAAFQGSANSRLALGFYYYSRMYNLMTIGDEGGEDWKRNLLLALYWLGKAAEVEPKSPEGCQSLPHMAYHLDMAMKQWHPEHNPSTDPLPEYSHIPFITWALAKGGQYTTNIISDCSSFDQPWKRQCASCGSREKDQLKACARCKAFHYCSKECQVKHWKAGHKVDCKGHWIEKYFPEIRKAQE